MIQRIQSIYLILGALCLAGIGLFDILWEGQAADTLVWYIPGVALFGAVTAVSAIVAVFLYTNRRKQLKLVVAVQVMTIIFAVIFYGGLFLAGEFYVLRRGADDLPRLLYFLLPVIAYIFFYLARRGIQRDIKLVKSMDRLR